MPITPTYPGIYIEELPASTHTITAALTSVTVFAGYTHPFKTKSFNKAVELFSFTDYEREFGGLYQSGIDANVAYAVNQFFLNGGSDAIVVGLKPGGVTAAHADVGQTIHFTALEPTDKVPMTVTVNNVQGDVADITIAYGSKTGSKTEVYRKVSVADTKTRINGISSLVTVATDPSASFVAVDQELFVLPLAGTAGIFNAADFTAVFKQDSSLDKVAIFNLLVIPGITNNGVLSDALAFCERKQAFLIMDPPLPPPAQNGVVADPNVTDTTWIGDYMDDTAPKSQNGAIYFPFLQSTDPLTGDANTLPPSGFVAGIYARTDTNRGVWKAPAGLETIVRNTTGVIESGRMTDMRHGTLNRRGVNCLRSFPGSGTVVFGARTLVGADTNTAFQQWKYVPVRRMALFIEQTLYRSLGWVVFEPNDDPLWVAIRTTIENFMLSLFNQGAFQGTTPSQAFQVKCDGTTTTQQDINNGIVNIIVAFAPLKPAEFVIIKIAQLAGQTQA